LAREVLTDLAADHVHGPQEPILRLPDFAAAESQHADRLAFGAHRKTESTVHDLVKGKPGLRDAGVAGDVGAPARLSRPPRAGGRLAHRPLYSRRQAHEVALEDVVGRAVLQRPDGVVLTEGSGDEDERDLGDDLARDPERAHAVELGHAEVRKDDMRTEFADLATEV